MTFKWTHFGEQAFYERLTTSLGFSNLAGKMKWNFTLLDVNIHMKNLEELDRDEDTNLVTFHGAHPKIYRKTVRNIRDRFPNAFVISLGSDSIPYLYGFPSQGMMTFKDYEFNSPEDVDLHLDTLSEVIEKYSARGIKCGQWMWTASQAHLDELKQLYKPIPLAKKEIGFYSLIAVKTPYRQKLREILSSQDVKSIIGPGHHNMDQIYRDYISSALIVGTTSGSWTPQRTMKGFRDWIAPTLGSVLVYDDHHDIRKTFGNRVWTYDYNKPEQLYDLLESIIGKNESQEYNQARYDYILNLQREWIEANTIENQFQSIIKRELLK